MLLPTETLTTQLKVVPQSHVLARGKSSLWVAVCVKRVASEKGKPTAAGSLRSVTVCNSFHTNSSAWRFLPVPVAETYCSCLPAVAYRNCKGQAACAERFSSPVGP